MPLDLKGQASKIRSHVKATRALRKFEGHEPVSTPGVNLSGGMWLVRMGPVRTSGLTIVSMRVVWLIQVYKPGLAAPRDDIDPAVGEAIAKIQERLIGDFTLGDSAREIDIFGEHGIGMDSTASWTTIEQTKYRCLNLQVPVIVNDCFTMTA